MRDGIWKGLRLPREWKAVLRSCTREAERGEVVQSKLAHALAKSLAGLSPAFLRRLRLRALEEGPGLPGLSDASSLGAESVLEGLVAARLIQLEAAGHNGDALMQQAVVEATQQWQERMIRHIRQHCHHEAGAGAGVVVAALTAASAVVDVCSIAAARIAGERPPRSSPLRPISLDGDDLAGAS
jgi:hypothetical protein